MPLPNGDCPKPVARVRKVKKYCDNCETRMANGGYGSHMGYHEATVATVATVTIPYYSLNGPGITFVLT